MLDGCLLKKEMQENSILALYDLAHVKSYCFYKVET